MNLSFRGWNRELGWAGCAPELWGPESHWEHWPPDKDEFTPWSGCGGRPLLTLFAMVMTRWVASASSCEKQGREGTTFIISLPASCICLRTHCTESAGAANSRGAGRAHRDWLWIGARPWRGHRDLGYQVCLWRMVLRA